MTNIISILSEELKTLDEAGRVLSYSFDKCNKIGIKDKYSDEELESFDSLTSRFARLSDLLIQKIFKMIEKTDLDIEGTVRDRINKVEKKGLINSAETFIEIRDLRNTIAHEYIPESYKEIFKKVKEFTPALLGSIKLVKDYCREKYGIL